MSSVEYLREFVNQRLSAAAEEIFKVFLKTIADYEEEINRKRKLLDVVWKPEINLHRELPQKHVLKEEPLIEHIHVNRENNCIVYLEEPQPQRIKQEEEAEALCTTLDEGQFVPKQEINTFVLTAAHRESDDSDLRGELPQQHVLKEEKVPAEHIPESQRIKQEEEEMELCTTLEEEQFVPKEEIITFVLTAAHEESDASDPELESDYKLPTSSSDTDDTYNPTGGKHGNSSKEDAESKKKKRSCKSGVAKKQSQIKGKQGNSHSIPNVEQKPTKRKHRNTIHSYDVNNSTTSKSGRKKYTEKKTCQCDTCGKLYVSKSKLAMHLTSHTGEKPHICNICGKGFAYMKLLQQHLKRHNDEKPYLCVTCGKKFILRSYLTIHTRIHTGEKPHSCQTCGKKFRKSCKLRIHQRSHTGEKPYCCKECGRSFAHSATLANHIKSHKHERTHCCEECGKSFKQKKKLKLHMKTHRGKKPSDC